MRKASTDVINLSCEAAGNQQYDNHPVAQVNDHVIRIATMTEPYHWHRHPDSDESFLALEGGLYIDLDDRPWNFSRALCSPFLEAFAIVLGR